MSTTSTANVQLNVNDLFEMSKHMNVEQLQQAMTVMKQIANGEAPAASQKSETTHAVNSAQHRADFLTKYLVTFLKPWIKLSEELHLENDKSQPVAPSNSCSFRTKQKYMNERPKLEDIMTGVITPAVTQMFSLTMEDWTNIRNKCLEKRPQPSKSSKSSSASKKRKQKDVEEEEEEDAENEEGESGSNQTDEDAVQSSPAKPVVVVKTEAPAAAPKKRTAAASSTSSTSAKPAVVTTTTSIVKRKL